MADDMETWIKEKARELAHRTFGHCAAWAATGVHYIECNQLTEEIVQFALSAVMRERERCAGIADTMVGWFGPATPHQGEMEMAQNFAKECADAIRTAETPDGK